MAGPVVSATLDQRQYAAAMKRIAKYEGRPLQRRAKQAYIEGARFLVRPIRNAAPVGATGNLRRSVSARPNRLRPGEMAAATAGTRFRIAPHRHLVIAGTAPHSLEGGSGKRPRPNRSPWSRMPDGAVIPNRYLFHPGSKANPFVERAVQPLLGEVQSFINARVLDIGETFTARLG